MLDDELDLILHVGDHIYELTWGDLAQSRIARVLFAEDYRAPCLYRSDRPASRACAYPWLAFIDDHEVDNCADDTSEENDEPSCRTTWPVRTAPTMSTMPLPSRMTPFDRICVCTRSAADRS
jgi:phosphodiesterase/alkaline phosphatase D-like protein